MGATTCTGRASAWRAPQQTKNPPEPNRRKTVSMPFMQKTPSARLLAACLVFSAVPCAALAQDSSEAAPKASSHSHAAAKPATHSGNRVLDGIGRGTDAAGRGIAHGADATRRG